MRTLQQSLPPSSSNPSLGKDQRHGLVRPAGDVAMTPTSISDLRVIIITRPAPRLRCAAPPRLAVDDVLYASTRHLSFPVPSSSCSKTMPPRGRTTLKGPSSSDPGDPDLGFPPEQSEIGDANCIDDASIRKRRQRHRHRPPWPKPARFSPAAAPPYPAVVWIRKHLRHEDERHRRKAGRGSPTASHQPHRALRPAEADPRRIWPRSQIHGHGRRPRRRRCRRPAREPPWLLCAPRCPGRPSRAQELSPLPPALVTFAPGAAATAAMADRRQQRQA